MTTPEQQDNEYNETSLAGLLPVVVEATPTSKRRCKPNWRKALDWGIITSFLLGGCASAIAIIDRLAAAL